MSKDVFAGHRSSRISAVCIGVFDGVHAGHRRIIRQTVARAKSLGAVSIGVTFDPHPSRVLAPHKMTPMLFPIERRIELMREAGLDRCVVLPFTKRLSRVPAAKFIAELLVKRLRAKAVCAGMDFRFGRGAEGDAAYLRARGKEFGFSAVSLPPVRMGGKNVSSTRIRELVTLGKLKEAARLLGRPFSISGAVTRGDGRGKRIGFPTVNLKVSQDTLPPQGVYAILAKCGTAKYAGALHLGPRPTFGQPQFRVEAHLLDAGGSFYGKRMEFVFVKRLRPLTKFRTINDLCAQIQKDVARVRLSVRV